MKQLPVEPITLIMKRLTWEGSTDTRPDFSVYHGGKDIGRIYETWSGGWYWGLDFLASNGVRPLHGYALSREAAQQQFRECYEKALMQK